MADLEIMRCSALGADPVPQSCEDCTYNIGASSGTDCIGPCGQQNCWYSCTVCRYNSCDGNCPESDTECVGYVVKGFGLDDCGVEWGIETYSDGSERIVCRDASASVECYDEKEAEQSCIDTLMMWADEGNAGSLAAVIRHWGFWDIDLLKKLCNMAGLSEEWEAADEMTFEDVAYKAAEILGVDID